MPDRFVDFETPICAEWLNPVDRAVFDALGAPSTPGEARAYINAVEESTVTGPAVRQDQRWVAARLSDMGRHNDLQGRSSADCHPIDSITGLRGALDELYADRGDAVVVVEEEFTQAGGETQVPIRGPYSLAWINGTLLDTSFPVPEGALVLSIEPPVVADADVIQSVTFDVLKPEYFELTYASSPNGGLINITHDTAVVFVNGKLMSSMDFDVLNNSQIYVPEGGFTQILGSISEQRRALIQTEEFTNPGSELTFIARGTSSYLVGVFVNGYRLASSDYTRDQEVYTLHSPVYTGTVQIVRILRPETLQGITVGLASDLAKTRPPGLTFNYEQFRKLEELENILSWHIETVAQYIRNNNGSGFALPRMYQTWGYLSCQRRTDGWQGALTVHSHADIDSSVMGMAELSAVVNGHFLQIRHTDYRTAQPEPTPSEPYAYHILTGEENADITDLTTMRRYYSALGQWQAGVPVSLNAPVDWRSRFDVVIAYLECFITAFPENLGEVDPPSPRHAFPFSSFKTMHDVMAGVFAASGVKHRFENTAWLPPIVRYVDETGMPQWGYLNARVVVNKVGTVADWEDLPARLFTLNVARTRQATGLSPPVIKFSRHARFMTTPAGVEPTEENFTRSYLSDNMTLVDEMMAKVWGFDGRNGYLEESIPVTESLYQRTFEPGTTTRLNAAMYNRMHSFERGAANQNNAMRGYHDSGLYVAKTTNPVVMGYPFKVAGSEQKEYHRYSWALPMEVLIMGPVREWNPYNLPRRTSAQMQGNGTEANPYNGYGTFNTPMGGVNYRCIHGLYETAATWVTGSPYTATDIAADPQQTNSSGDPISYICTASYADPVPLWASGGTYALRSLVRHEGIHYQAKRASSGSSTPPPDAPSVWKVTPNPLTTRPRNNPDCWSMFGDPADTGRSKVWVWQNGTIGGTKREVTLSGTHTSPQIVRDVDTNDPFVIRQRFPVAQFSNDMTVAAADTTALRKDLLAAGVEIPEFTL